MKAGVVVPGQKDSAGFVEIDIPVPQKSEVLVKILEVGIDGTDMEINQGDYGESPPDQEFIILGHEALGKIEKTGDTDFRKGDLVMPVVRRPDDCSNCQSGQPDMCIEGNYRERGIRGAHGFLREYVADEPRFLVRVPQDLRRVVILTEPLSIVTKGITQAMEFHRRSSNPVQTALVLGAGSLGLLTTALLRIQGINTYTLDILPKSSLKGQLVEATGATYLDGRDYHIDELPRQLGNIDLIMEATGNSTVAFQATSALGINGVCCLMGVPAGDKLLEIRADYINLKMVLGNQMVFGMVSANRSHYECAALSLAEIEQEWPGWLVRLITRRLPLANFKDALQPHSKGIKTVIEIS